MQSNRVIVLLPHYNSPDGLIKSLESLKSERNFDLLVIDDGSRDQELVKQIINDYKPFFTIYSVLQAENRGITETLNNGLKFILSFEKKYEFIARLDAGDVCVNDRFQKQVDFLDAYPNVYLLGSWVNYVDLSGKKIFTLKYPQHHKAIKNKIFLFNTFNHPAVMFRTSALEKVGFYPDQYPALEDHAYFFKFIKAFQAANLPEVLLHYEINPDGISLSKRSLQVKSRLKLLKDNFKFGFYPAYGLLRNMIIFALPPSFLIKLKSMLFSK